MSNPTRTTATPPRTAIVTGASQGIGAAVVRAFLDRGYNIVANSRGFDSSSGVPNENLALVNGDIGQPSTAKQLAETAIGRFGAIDILVNNAGIFFTKPFIDYTPEDFRRLAGTNLEGYIYITQLAVKQMLLQKNRGSVTCVTSAMVRHPISGVNASIPMITKGGLEAITLSLAMEYAKDGIRFNAVAPGVVDTPLTAGRASELLRNQSPMGEIVETKDIVDAILYLTDARYVTGEILNVDAGMHNGKW